MISGFLKASTEISERGVFGHGPGQGEWHRAEGTGVVSGGCHSGSKIIKQQAFGCSALHPARNDK